MTDLRLAFRRLAASPGFTLLAVVLLALGIGANAVIYGAFDALVLRPLVSNHPEQLVHFYQELPRVGKRSSFPYRYYRALREHASTLATVFGQEDMQVAMGRPAPAEQVMVHLVTEEYFEALGASPELGRALGRADAAERPGAPPAVLSFGFWQRRFAGSRGVLGRRLELHGHEFIIVGVMPADFRGYSIDTAPDVWAPLGAAQLLQLDERYLPVENRWLDLAARMKPGVTRERALAECRAMFDNFKDAAFHYLPLQLDSMEHGLSILRDRFRAALRLLIASVALLQLLVCINLAGLLLARGAKRQSEIAIRLALGATRWRLGREMLAECLLLTLAGAAGGVALAYFAAPLLERALPPIRDIGTTRLALAVDFTPNLRVLLYSLAVSALTVLLCGMAPAWAAARVSLDAVLRGARAASGWNGRRFLLALEIALSTILLAGAGVMVRSFQRLHGMDPCFASAHVVTFTADPSLAGYKYEQGAALRAALMERVRQLPGVESVAAAARAVMRGSGIKSSVVPSGQPPSDSSSMNATFNSVTPGYFETMGMRFLAGRDFSAEDAARTGLNPVVVNRTFARKFFPGEDAIGRTFGGLDASGPTREIVGVVNDAHYRSLREPIQPVYYTPLNNTDFVLCVRTRQSPESLEQPVRQVLASLDPSLAFTEVHTLAEEVDASAAPERLTAVLAAIFGLLAALLAAVGLYGLLACAVAERRREIGIRMALGARPRAVARLIGGQALVLAGPGVAAGLTGARLLAPLAGALVYGVAPADAASLAGAGMLVIAVSLVAAMAPALRAARIDPVEALRE